MTKKGVIFFLIRVSVAAILIYYLIRTGKLDFSILFGEKFRWGLAFLGFIIYFFIGIFGAYRWQILLTGQGIHITFLTSLRLSYIGLFFNISMPGSTGGDVMRAYYATLLAPDKKTAAVTSVFFDRVVGVAALILLAFVAAGIYLFTSPAGKTVKALFVCITIMLALIILITVIIYRRREESNFLKWCRTHLPLGEILGKAYDSVVVYRSRKAMLAWAVLLSLCAHIVAVCSNYLFAVALGVEPASFWVFLFLIPVALFVESVPVSIAGLGWGEAAYGLLFSVTGYSSILGTSVAAVMHCARIIWGLAGAAFYLVGKRHQPAD